MNKLVEEFLKLFYKLSQVPRESGKEEKFADFLEEFARANNLECYRDKNKNVEIKRIMNQLYYKHIWIWYV